MVWVTAFRKISGRARQATSGRQRKFVNGSNGPVFGHSSHSKAPVHNRRSGRRIGQSRISGALELDGHAGDGVGVLS
jgi:hypothetical protein